MQDTRRVRTLRLTAPDEGLICRGVTLVEDALRTASLPRAYPGRVLLIRSLALGRIDALQTPATVMLTLERRLAQIAAGAVHAQEQSAATCPAVFFRDTVEPLVMLAGRLARHERIHGWFWRSAVPAWQPEMSRDQGLRAVLYAATETEAGPAAALALLQSLHADGALEPVLQALRPADGLALLRAFGWTAPPAFSPSDAARLTPVAGREDTLPPEWEATVAQWAVRWHPSDTRSVWLGAVALAASKPIRLLDSRMTVRAKQVLETIVPKQTMVQPAAQPPAAANTFDSGRVSQGTDSAGRPATSSPDAVTADPHTGIVELEDGQTGMHTGRTTPPGSAASQRGAGKAVAVDAARRDDGSTAALPSVLPAASGMAPPHGEDSGQAGDPLPHPEEESLLTLGASGDLRPDEPRRTGYAGLFYLIPAMARLGVAQLLASYPDLVELELPHRVLARIARRLKIPEDDPVFLPLHLPAEDDPGPCEFVVPLEVWRLLHRAGTFRVQRVDGSDGATILTDSSGRLALALWRGEPPGALRRLLPEKSDWERVAYRPDVTVLVNSWTTGLRRLCRRTARLGLKGVAARPGSIAVTRTHLDVMFTLSQIDIQIRRAGFDIDPGWAPWFGRVVQFRYLEREDDYGTG